VPARVGIDWSRPFLPMAADWLLERSAGGDGGARGAGGGEQRTADLSRFVCVTPGRRAGRALIAILASRCHERGLSLLPPRAMTPGGLAEALLVCGDALATRLERRLAWMTALRAGAGDGDGDLAAAVTALVPTAPAVDDLIAWRDVAGVIERVHDELAGDHVGFERVAQQAEMLQMLDEADRWRGLESLLRVYRETLAEVGLRDPYDARNDALEGAPGAAGATADTDVQIVLLGVTELNEHQRSILRAFGDCVVALVHAPDGVVGDDFDEFGGPETSAWGGRRLSVRDEQIVVADKPADQARAAIAAIAAMEGTGAGEHAGTRAAEEITIGVGDPELVEPMTREAHWAGLDVHAGSGVVLTRTAPYTLLAAIGAWLGGRRFADLAALVRHPDFEPRLRAVLPVDAEATPDVPAALDRAFSRRLPDRLPRSWEDNGDGPPAIAQVGAAVDRILAPLVGPDRSIAGWCTELSGVLADLYAAVAAAPVGVGATAGATVAELLATAAELPGSLLPRTDAREAIAFLLTEWSGEVIPSDVRADQIEMLGWLELHLDPAPVLCLLGMNDGCIPQTITADPFLPDALRRELGLMDDAKRAARDAYLLEAITHAREHLVVITGRRGADGEPLEPSRLLLACDDETMLTRIHRMFGRIQAEAEGPPLPPGAPAPGAVSRFKVPDLPDCVSPPESMAVTEFSAYLRCPYRYALDRRLRLRVVEDTARELDPLQFGTLAHHVLESFGRDERGRESRDADEIERVLIAAMQESARRRFGPDPLPAVRLQIVRLRERLASFARLQAQLRRDGWVIRHTEFELTGAQALDVPGQADMPLRGKIDRIDQHEDTGAWRIIDYKTGDTGRSPEQTHNGTSKLPDDGDPEWLDLQLPLYRYLVRAAGVTDDAELAYVTLPKAADDTKLQVARWDADQLDAAVEEARNIVREIRAGDYEKPRDIRTMFDEYARICQSFAFADDEDAT